MSFHTPQSTQYGICSTVGAFDMSMHCIIDVCNTFEDNKLHIHAHAHIHTYKRHRYIDKLSHEWIN